MDRATFILKTIGGFLAMNSLKDLKKFTDTLRTDGVTMPMLFVGHGSPMNGIEDNEFSLQWEELGKSLPQPKAVICVSAHWLTHGTHITAMDAPRTIHDFGGFPKELFDVQYPAPGNKQLAIEAASLVQSTTVGLDHEWGLDHGSWTVIRRMYPQANIPVLQLSIDYSKGPEYHYVLAKEFAALRKKGVLIMGSGNMVHNLRMLNWQTPDKGFDWADEMNDQFKKHLLSGNHQPLINYDTLGSAARMSIPTPDHYYPMLYVLGLQQKNEDLRIFNDKTVMGSISMTSFIVN